MKRSPFRLAPRLAARPDELDWVLARAFGPLAESVPAPPSGERAAELARSLELAGRIGGRTSSTALARELGAAAGRVLAFEHLRIAAINRELRDTVDRVRNVAEQQGIDVVWLKFAALDLGGYLAIGSREARDVDLLAAELHGVRLHAALEELGFRVASRHSAPHQLPPLLAPSGAAIEVHRSVWGLALRAGAKSAQMADLTPQHTALGLAGTSIVPRPELLVAHALVHALVQHRSTPTSYAPFRVVADLVDLKAWEQPVSAIHEFISDELSAAEVACACTLARDLSRGTALDALAAPEAELLSGLVAASIDPAFQSILAVGRVAELLRDGELTRAIARTLFKESESGAERLREPLRRAWRLASGCARYARASLGLSRVRRTLH